MELALRHVFEGQKGLDEGDFHVVILYESTEAARIAQQAYGEMIKGLEVHRQIDRSLWMFTLLQNNKLRGMAAEEAANAQCIIVAMQAGRNFPTEVKRWFQLWLKRKVVEHPTLIVLLDRSEEMEEEVEPRIRAYLQQLISLGVLVLLATPNPIDQDTAVEPLADFRSDYCMMRAE